MADEEEFVLEPPEDQTPDPDAVNASTKTGTRKQRDRKRTEADIDAAFWREVLKSEDGRAVVFRFLMRAGTFTAPFAVGPNGFPQSDATWFKAGQQALGLELYQNLLRLDFLGVHEMLKQCDPAFKPEK
ncbi:MAG: hypothetical protein WCP82_04555 [Alphaproteobacteria bacterium]